MTATSFVGCGSLYAQQYDRPNIIVFIVDDMGWQDTSLPFWDKKTKYNEMYETPNMERLARQGMLFTQAYASSISSPTRCSIMTRVIRLLCPSGIVMVLPKLELCHVPQLQSRSFNCLRIVAITQYIVVRRIGVLSILRVKIHVISALM